MRREGRLSSSMHPHVRKVLDSTKRQPDMAAVEGNQGEAVGLHRIRFPTISQARRSLRNSGISLSSLNRRTPSLRGSGIVAGPAFLERPSPHRPHHGIARRRRWRRWHGGVERCVRARVVQAARCSAAARASWRADRPVRRRHARSKLLRRVAANCREPIPIRRALAPAARPPRRADGVVAANLSLQATRSSRRRGPAASATGAFRNSVGPARLLLPMSPAGAEP